MMDLAIILYIVVGLLLAEAAFKRVQENPERFPGYGVFSYLVTVLFWPLFFLKMLRGS